MAHVPPPPMYEGGPVPFGPIPPRHADPAVRDPQRFAEETLRYHHDNALFEWGEYAMFVLLWTSRDHEAGLVDRCEECYVPMGDIAEAYGQAPREKCPVCFGTTWQGGFRAIIVRPSLWTDTDDQDREEESRGTVVRSTAEVQSTSDFVLRRGDYIIRSDGSRWQVSVSDSQAVTTGFGSKTNPYANVGDTGQTCLRLDESHVAYIIGPTTEQAIEILEIPNSRRPIPFGQEYDWGYEGEYEPQIVNGPLW